MILQKSNAAKFAEYVLEKYGGGVGAVVSNKAFDKECQLIMNEDCPNPRIHVLMVAADRLIPKNDREVSIKVGCYIAAGASGYDGVIRLAPDLIAHSNFEWSYYPDGEKRTIKLRLIQAYEGKKKYWNALELHENLYKDEPWDYHHVAGMVKNLNELCAFDSALQVINDVKKSEFYNIDAKSFHTFFHKQQWIIQEKRREFNEKKSGYKFPPISFSEYMKSHPITGSEENFFKNQIDRAELTIASAIVGKRNRDDYKWICENLPSECPKSYGGYIRMKNQNTKNFRRLVDLCSEQGKNIEVEDKFAEQSRKLREIVKAEEAAYWERRNKEDNV